MIPVHPLVKLKKWYAWLEKEHHAPESNYTILLDRDRDKLKEIINQLEDIEENK
jgi:acetolactate synthase small subunit